MFESLGQKFDITINPGKIAMVIAILAAIWVILHIFVVNKGLFKDKSYAKWFQGGRPGYW